MLQGHSLAKARKLVAVGAVIVLVAGLLGASAMTAQAAGTGHITGTVTKAGGTGIADVDVAVYQLVDYGGFSYWDYLNDVYTAEDGSYDLSGLATGTYRVGFQDYNGVYAGEYYNNASTVDSAQDIAATTAMTTANINAELTVGSHIKGRVTKAGGIGLPNIGVTAYQDGPYGLDYVASASTGSTGNYDLSGLAAGTYVVGFDDYDGTYLSEYWNNSPDEEHATTIVVGAAATVTGKSALLDAASHIKGVVTKPGGAALPNAYVSAYQLVDLGGGDTYWESVNGVQSNSAGAYDIGGLRAGTYRIGFWDFNGTYLPEYYDNSAKVGDATDIVVAANASVIGKNAELALAGHITGKVTKPGGVALAGISVEAYRHVTSDNDDYWDQVNDVYTTASGNFNLGGLAPGTYRIGFSDYNGAYLPEYWNNVTSVESANDIVVAAGATVTGKSATLAVASHITGKVTKPGGATLANAPVTVYKEVSNEDGRQWDEVGYDQTNSAGAYDVGGLAAGNYRIGFDDYSGTYASEFFNNSTTLAGAVNVAVPAAATVAGKNAELAPAGHIKGKVTKSGGLGLANISVTAYQQVNYGGGSYWDQVSYGTPTGQTGNYDVGGLAAGTYRIGFEDYDGDGYLSEYWNNVADVDHATNVVVGAGATVVGKNAMLDAGSHVTGTVTKAGGTALSGIGVALYQSVVFNGVTSWDYSTGSMTRADGTYDVRGVRPGTYRIGFEDQGNTGYAPEFYDNVTTVAAAADVVVPALSTVSGKDAEMALGGHIKGKVTGSAGVALPGIGVSVYTQTTPGSNAQWDYVGDTETSATGLYDLAGLAPVVYRLGFFDEDESYLSEFWNNKTTLDAATNITVAAGAIVTGKNAGLSPAATISGTVTLPSGTRSEGGDGSVVAVNNATGAYAGYGYAGSSPGAHAYKISGLAPGSYRVEFARESGESMAAAQFYNGVAESAGTSAANAVVLAGGQQQTGINATLAVGGKIVGTVVNAAGQPLVNCEVAAFTSGDSLVRRSDRATNAAGGFTITGLSTGSYKIEIRGDDLTGGDGCAGGARYYISTSGTTSTSATNALPVAVTRGGTTTLPNPLKVGATLAVTNSVAPTVKGTGTAQVGATFTADNGTWAPSGVRFGYQWRSGSVDIPGATNSTYTADASDEGKALSVTVVGSKAGFTTLSKTSAGTAAVVKGTITNSVLPSITGTSPPSVGSPLTAVDGTWSPSGVTFKYQWLADGVAISGATGNSYQPSVAGQRISVTVRGEKPGYTSLERTSAQTEPVG